MKQSPERPIDVNESSEAPIWVTEPFRVFFPLGIVMSLLGVLMWPLFYAGVWKFPPHLQHPRIMVFGFGLAFVIGFLGTAWPRFLESAVMKRHELGVLVITWTTAQFFYACHKLTIGDGGASLCLLTFLIILGSRARQATSFPPPGFALVFAALMMGFGTVLTWTIFPTSMSAEVYLFTKLAAYQGLLLLPILGVGSYLFPRFFATDGVKPIMAKPSFRRVGVWGTAILILISFGIEAVGWVRMGNGIRFAALIWWAFAAAPAVWKAKVQSTRAWALRIGIGSIGLSFLVRAIWPGPGYAFEHLLFLGGFGVVIFLVADRVSVGHGGDASILHHVSKLWRWIVWLILLTIATRLPADFKASIMVSHHIYAAISWCVVVILWTCYHVRHWRAEN